jgi:hypothetical protein
LDVIEGEFLGNLVVLNLECLVVIQVCCFGEFGVVEFCGVFGEKVELKVIFCSGKVECVKRGFYLTT